MATWIETGLSPSISRTEPNESAESVSHPELRLPSLRSLPGCLYHRHDAGADDLGQNWPCVDNGGQVGVTGSRAGSVLGSSLGTVRGGVGRSLAGSPRHSGHAVLPEIVVRSGIR